MKNKIIVILGPTASGKTGWGISLAKKFNGEVISADSRTVYKYLNIATAKPKGRNCGDREERKLGCRKVEGIKHYLLDFINPHKFYTVAEFQDDANQAIKLIIAKGKLPVIVGGSALYIYGLVRGYQFPGQGDPKLRRELEAKTVSELQTMVRRNKKILLNSSDFRNKRRLIRALEISKKNKLKNKNFHYSPIPYSFLKIGIDRPRAEIYNRIDRRTEVWIKEGLIKEVRRLIKNGISKKRIYEFGLGYREVLKYLSGDINNIEGLLDRVNFSQHTYVRHQMTWFRRDKEIHWCKNLADAEKLVRQFLR